MNGQLDSPSQNFSIDSLENALKMARNDSNKIIILKYLGQQFRNAARVDSSLLIYQQALELIQKNKYSLEAEYDVLGKVGFLSNVTGNYALNMRCANRGLEISEKTGNVWQKGFALASIGSDYFAIGDYKKALDYFFEAKKTFEKVEPGQLAIQNIAETYLKMHLLDSALYFNKLCYHIADTGHNQQYMKDYAIRVFANIYSEKGNDLLALKYYRQFVNDFYQYNLNNREIGHAYFSMAELFLKNKETDSAIIYSKKALESARKYYDQQNIYNSSSLLYSIYGSMQQKGEAFYYLKISSAAKDSVISLEKIKQIQTLAFNEQIREKEKQESEEKEKARTRLIVIVSAVIILIVSFLIWSRIRQLRLRYRTILEQKETEKLKEKYDKELLTLEARALRAQMNPHFIFNCMNSIKALIQNNVKEKSIEYLTTFSKLIRTLFQNSDKRLISLYDEIETCRLYTQLEAMRFTGKLNCEINIDPDLDIKSLMVPALIIQPFIENAIWHGIVPKGSGTIKITVKGNENAIICEVDDDGIGREMSKLNKPRIPAAHESKGMHLSQARLDLEKMLNEMQATIEINDKYEYDRSGGTKVVITFKIN